MSAETQSLQRQADRTRPGMSSVLGYVVVLFAVAFVLLLLAFFMQERSGLDANGFSPERSDQETVQSLQEQLYLLRLLERLEFLVSADQAEAAAQLWDPALETVLPGLDDPELYSAGQFYSEYAEQQPTITERVQALKAVLFPDEY